jgi:hypothetical protein
MPDIPTLPPCPTFSAIHEGCSISRDPSGESGHAIYTRVWIVEDIVDSTHIVVNVLHNLQVGDVWINLVTGQKANILSIDPDLLVVEVEYIDEGPPIVTYGSGDQLLRYMPGAPQLEIQIGGTGVSRFVADFPAMGTGNPSEPGPAAPSGPAIILPPPPFGP